MSDKVDTAEKTAQHQNPLELVDWLSDNYKQLDQNKNGRLSAGELKSASEATLASPGQRAATYALNHLEIVENENWDQWGWEKGITKIDLTKHKQHLESGLKGDSGKELRAALSQAANLREFIQKTMPRIDDDANGFISYPEIVAFAAMGNPTQAELTQATFIRDHYDDLKSVRFLRHSDENNSFGDAFGKRAPGIQSQDVLNLEDALNPAVRDGRRKIDRTTCGRELVFFSGGLVIEGTAIGFLGGSILGAVSAGPAGVTVGATGGAVVGFAGSLAYVHRRTRDFPKVVDGWHDGWAERGRAMFLDKPQTR